MAGRGDRRQGLVIVVAGEALVDLLVRPDGSVSAIQGGGPFTTARTIGRLGVPVAFLGRLSADGFGRAMAARLATDGVALARPDSVAEPTTLALAELDAEGHAQYRFYLDRTSVPGLVPSDLAQAIAARPVAVHVGTLGLVAEPIASTLEAFVAGLAPDVVLMLDPNCRPSAIPDPGRYRDRLQRIRRRADVVKLSMEDLAYLHPGTPVEEAAPALLARIHGEGPAAVLVTDGPRPVIVYARDGERRVPVRDVQVVDTVGAGDAFGGAFLAWWIASGLGRNQLGDLDALEAAAEAAVEVAAVTCERVGADPPTITELTRPWRLWTMTAGADSADFRG
jgi:fructokinase